MLFGTSYPDIPAAAGDNRQGQVASGGGQKFFDGRPDRSFRFARSGKLGLWGSAEGRRRVLEPVAGQHNPQLDSGRPLGCGSVSDQHRQPMAVGIFSGLGAARTSASGFTLSGAVY